YQQIEQPLTAVLIAMERIGVRLDLAVLAEINQALSADLEELRQQAIQAAGGEFNLDSPKQLAAVLFEKLNLPALKKTRSGYSTDAAVLEELQPLHPLPGLMLEYRELAKLKSTYLDALPRLVDAQSHLHTSFNQMVTATGRLSSTEPNLQNIPVRRQIGRQIRQAFIPDAQALGTETAVLLSADYSQIELRLLAHLSGDAGLIQAFQSGADFHAMTAARVWNLAPEQVSAELRSRAKAVNFGIVYGQQAFGLSRSLGIGFAEAQSLIDRYFEAFPAVKTYLEQIVATAYTQGWVATMFGRRRYIRELKSSNPNTRHFGERTAMNHPMQGSAADIIKLAMLEVSRRIQAEDYPAQLILQVHDELVFNCALSAAADLSRLVQDVMENVVELQVPLLVSISQGANWAELH
ncbi:MAG: DNA polymerase, partial [Actinomycetia bacterium]|nr:DNA polymerase [Actinomycetes bacterium]